MLWPNGTFPGVMTLTAACGLGLWLILTSKDIQQAGNGRLEKPSFRWIVGLMVTGLVFVGLTGMVNVFHLGSSSKDPVASPTNTSIVNNYYGGYLDSAKADVVPNLSIATQSRNREASVTVANSSSSP